jgi:hypothetical protein
MIDIKEHHIQFEGKKLSMIQNKRDGHVLRLAVNPVDTPDELFRDAVDQRYLVVMVKLADETDDIVPINPEGQKALALFATLTKNEDFQLWLYNKRLSQEFGEEAAVNALKGVLGIESRAELKSSPQKRAKLFAIRDDFAYNIRAK